MRTDEPLANLQRRLGLRSESLTDVKDGCDKDGWEAAESEDAVEPSWVPDGLTGAHSSRGRHWLTAIRADPGRAGGIALAVVAALAVLVTVFTLARARPAPIASANLPPVEMVSTSTAAPAGAAAPSTAQPLVVSVVGLVQQPGLVTVAPDARVADAVSAAGGALHGADTLGLNLARHLADGEQVVVGIAAPAGQPTALGSSVGSAAAPQIPAAPAQPVGPVDLNTATAEQLDTLPGVGPVTAAAIVAWRAA
jgi:competence protein ComEA